MSPKIENNNLKNRKKIKWKSELKSIINKMSNLIVGLNSIFELARKISSLEDKSIEIMQVKGNEY